MDISITTDEVVQTMQEMYPREFNVVVLSIENKKLKEQLKWVEQKNSEATAIEE